MTWEILWKWFVILGVSAFGIVAVWVTIGGFFDVRRMFRELADQQEED